MEIESCADNLIVFLYISERNVTFFTFFPLGYFMGTYFEISKPASVKFSFKEILRRTNSSFLLTIRLPSSLSNSPVQVSHCVLLNFFFYFTGMET